MNLDGKSVPQWRRDEAAENKVAKQREHQESLATIQGEAAGVAQAKETARQDRLKTRWKAVGAVAKSPYSVLAWSFKSADSMLSSGAKITLGIAGAAAVSAGVAGTIDHFDKPNPEQDPTLVRIIDFGTQNAIDVIDHYELSEKAVGVMGAFSRIGDRIRGGDVSGADQMPVSDWNEVPLYDVPLSGPNLNEM